MPTSNNDRLLVLGGSHADVPLIQAARRMGFSVYTTGNRQADPGHQHSDHYIKADYSDPEAMLTLAVALRVTAICPSANDFSAISCAFVADRLGFSGFDPTNVSLTIHHKDRFRQLATQLNLPTPNIKTFSSGEVCQPSFDGLKFPVIVKPVDLTGGKGIAVAHTKTQAHAAVTRAMNASRCKRTIVEDFLSGTYHGFTCILVGRRIAFGMSDNEYYYHNPYLVGGASSPTTASPDTLTALHSQIHTIADALELTDGLLHLQFIETAHEPVILDICRRPPGDLYVTFVEHATGVPYSDWILQCYLGQRPSIPSRLPLPRPFLRHCMMPDRAGYFHSYSIHPSIKDYLIDITMLMKPHQQIIDPFREKVGIAFLEFPTSQVAFESSRHMTSLLSISVTTSGPDSAKRETLSC